MSAQLLAQESYDALINARLFDEAMSWHSRFPEKVTPLDANLSSLTTQTEDSSNPPSVIALEDSEHGTLKKQESEP